MTFESIFYKNNDIFVNDNKVEKHAPDFFADLNLDQVIDDITFNKEVYNLKPFFYSKLNSVAAIEYCQEIMKDLENANLYQTIETFARHIREMRSKLDSVQKSFFKNEKERLFLDAVSLYISTINSLENNLSEIDLKSDGFKNLYEYLKHYTSSSTFSLLSEQTSNLIENLDSVKYQIHIKELRVEVGPVDDESDYSPEVENTFSKFQKTTFEDYRIKYLPEVRLNQVEDSILKGVALLYPELFRNLEKFTQKNAEFFDKKIERFDREVQFYISYLDYISELKKSGLKFCYPEISTTKDALSTEDGFDIALATKLIKEKSSIVCNDFCLNGPERVIVITGPNQGGKTTYARTIGQLHYLANIGLPVPGKKARLFLYDQLFTHFEEEERIEDHRSKLEADLIKANQIVTQCTDNSILIMNEILSSTSLQDAIYLSKELMSKIFELDALCVWVTFIDELASLNEKTVSMVSSVIPENPSIRTFKIVRQEASGLVYALSITEKHRLTYDDIIERIQE